MWYTNTSTSTRLSCCTLCLPTISILILMGVADTLALLIMVYAGNFEEPEFSSVSASTFGLITILLVCFFYKEKLSRIQFLGIFLVFSSVAILSFG